MSKLRFGIVGTGFIAGAIADAIGKSQDCALAAVSSRKQETADAFVASRPGAAAVEGWQALVARDDIDAIYVATPTVAKEEIALGAVAAGRHILVDKPFMSADSVRKMSGAAAARGLLFMDATHFVHNPRTHAIWQAMDDQVGTPLSLATSFYFPFEETTDNIRFDPSQEPTGSLGDLSWYSLRAAVEYLKPEGPIVTVGTHSEFDPVTGAMVRLTALVGFEGGRTTTFSSGYAVGAAVMDFELYGTKGVIRMDDFVLDWNNSFAFQNPAVKLGYTHVAGTGGRAEMRFVDIAPSAGQHVLMCDAFAALVARPDARAAAAHAEATATTQSYLDTVWAHIRKH